MMQRQLLRRLDTTLAHNSRVIEENSRVIEEYLRVSADVRAFTRDLVRRQERVLDEAIRELRDLRAESRAQREALLRLIDRLPPPADGPAAA